MGNPAGTGTGLPSDRVLEIARVLTTALKEGAAGANLVVLDLEGLPDVDMSDPTAPQLQRGDGQGSRTQEAEPYSAVGATARPLPPSASGHALVVCIRAGDELIPIGVYDPRLTMGGQGPPEGTICMVGYGSNLVKLDADGGISLITTTDATKDGQMVQMRLTGAGFQLAGPFGKLTYDQSGLHLLHYTGARIDLGGIGGLPAPFDTLGSYVTLGAAIAKIQSSAIALGPDAGSFEPASKAVSLLAVLSSIATALTAIGAGLATIPPALVPPNPAAATACTAAVTAVTAAVAAVAAGAATIPSSSTSVA